MKRLIVALAAIGLVAVASQAQAQDKYPSKPVKIVVPYAPGGATDITSRLFGEQLRNILGQSSWSRTSPAPAAFSPSKRWRARGRMVTR